VREALKGHDLVALAARDQLPAHQYMDAVAVSIAGLLATFDRSGPRTRLDA
jgi:hypothetical protein